jgi:periplasmic protein CpxP/Spy
MKQKDYHISFLTTLGVVMVAFLSTIFIANANLAFAASDKEKSPKVARTSAVVHTEAQIKQLQGALKITAAQEALWNNLTTVMRENAKEMDALAKNRHENKKTMNAVEHMKFHKQTTEIHLNQLNKFLPPFEALYASMSDDQKKMTDTIFQSGKPGKHKRK